MNPVSGAVGLLWTGNWHVCQTAVMTVLRGGTIEPMLDFDGRMLGQNLDNFSECSKFKPRNVSSGSKTTRTTTLKMKRSGDDDDESKCELTNLDLCLMYPTEKKLRATTPSEEESETTTLVSGGSTSAGTNCSLQGGERKLWPLFI